MIIICMIIYQIISLTMRKFVLWVFISIILPAFFVNNIVLAIQAEGEEPGGGNWKNVTDDIGINLSGNCLYWMWKWCFNYEKMIWIEDDQWSKYSAMSIAQDVILAATYMVWTVLTIVIIWCGLWYIFASRDGKDVNKYKKWLISAAIWAVLVRWAYAIVRLIQYVAKW